MRNLFIAAGILAIVLVVGFLWSRPVDVSVSPVETPPEKMAPVVSSAPDPAPMMKKTPEKKSTRESRSMAQASGKAVHSKGDLFAEFEVSDLPGTEYGVVTNYIAVQGTDPSPGRIIAGYQLQDASDGDPLNVLFDKKNRKYGVWTREIIVTGSEALINQLQQKLNLERVNSDPSRAMFRVPEQIQIEDVFGVPGLTVEPDLLFSRISSI